MLIVCPSCATSYDVEQASLPAGGRQVRCVRCRTVWRAEPAEPSRAEMLRAAAADIAPTAPIGDEILQAAFAEHPAPALATAQPGEADADWGQEPEPPSGEQPGDGAWVSPADIVPGAGAGADATEPGQTIDAPPIVPVDLDEGRLPADIDHDLPPLLPPEPLEDIETYADRHYRKNARRFSLRWPLSLVQSGILVLLILDAVLIGWRGKIVRALPQTASFYAMLGMPVNLRGLVFDDVATATEQREGVPILVVQGNVVNDTRRVVDVPRLKFTVRNAARQEVYSWTAVPDKTALPPGEALAFHTRLASPPPDGHDVLVRFLNRRDVVAGAR